jgi:hypothetical protein
LKAPLPPEGAKCFGVSLIRRMDKIKLAQFFREKLDPEAQNWDVPVG